jgi:alpha-L-fucosidase
LRFGVSSHTAEHWWWYGAARKLDDDVTHMTAETARLYGPAAPMELPGAGDDPAREPDPNHLERWLPPDRAFLDAWLARSTELVDKYRPDFVYFDWWIGQPAFKPYLRQFAAYYYDRSAEEKHAPVLTYKEESMPANAATLDIERGKLDTLRLLPWQTDTSVSIHSWGYVEHDEYRTAPSLIAQLLDTVAKNGNLLLNVGPRSDGTIPDEARPVLLQIGAWLKINGEAIYASRPFPVFGEGPTKAPKNSTEKNNDMQTYTPQDIRYTVSHDGATLYAATLAQPAAGDLTLHILFAGNPYLPQPVCSARLLGSSGELSFRQTLDGLHLMLPSVTGQAVVALRTRC